MSTASDASDSTRNVVAPTSASKLLASLAKPDKSDWSAKRIADYDALQSSASSENLEGVIRIPSVGIELPVYEGTEERSLTLGAGRIVGTPALGDAGNVGLAAHRDGYFRALQNVKIGDSIDVETMIGNARYKIVDLFIVNPEDVHVLQPTEKDSITLVTCYPFYFKGHAPRRFIVRAQKF